MRDNELETFSKQSKQKFLTIKKYKSMQVILGANGIICLTVIYIKKIHFR